MFASLSLLRPINVVVILFLDYFLIEPAQTGSDFFIIVHIISEDSTAAYDFVAVIHYDSLSFRYGLLRFFKLYM